MPCHRPQLAAPPRGNPAAPAPHRASRPERQGKSGKLSPEECTAFRARYSTDSTYKGLRPAEAKSAIAMPRLPADDSGKEFDIQVLVNVRGRWTA